MQFLSFLRSTHSKMKSLLSQTDRAEVNVNGPSLDTDLRALSQGAYSGYDRDFQRLIGDSRSTLKRLSRSFFPDGVDDKEPYAKNTYNNLYKINRAEGGGNHYGGLSLPTESDDAFNYALGGVRQQTINELIDIDYGGLHDQERSTKVNTALQKAYDTDQTSAYLNRPGVGPVLSMIGSATKEITIDIFQLQNKIVSDALTEKAKQGVTVNIRVAMPDGTEKDATGFSILGPNIIELEKFNRLRADMEREALEQGGVRPDINLFVADRKSHPKVLLTEREAMIGTLNLTQPVGSDPNQAGGNFEAIRRLSRGAYTPEMLVGIRGGTAEERSAKLYYQLRSVYHDESQGESKSPLAFMEQTGTRPAFTSQSQIVGPREIYQELRYALELAGDNSARQWRRMYAILNQPFLLMLDDPMHRDSMMGEMGRFDKQSSLTSPISQRALEYRDTQRRLFDLINQDRAFITVDNRGYIEKVVNPMYERIQRLVGDFETEYDGSLERLVQKLSGSGGYHDRLQRLTRELKGQSQEFDIDTARQLLAMTGGNIRLSTATMQHVKSFAVMEGKGDNATALSYYLGSSNLGAYSMSITPGDEDVVNREIGIALSGRETYLGPFSLTREEVSEELKAAQANFAQQWAGLTHTYIDNIDAPGTKAWYEGRVHSKGLMELSKRLKAIGEGLGPGFSTHYIYGGASGTERVGVEVGIDVGSLTGTGLGGKFNLRYSVLADIGGGAGLVYDLSTGKAISRSLLQNSSREGMMTPYGELSDNVKHQILDPVSTTINLVSTLTAEAMNRVYTWGPQSFIKDMDADERLGLILNYLDVKVSGKREGVVDKGTPGMFFFNAPADVLEQFSNQLEGMGVINGANLDRTKKLQAFTGGGSPEAKSSSHNYLAQALGFIDILTAKEGRATPEQWEMLRGGAGKGVGASLVNLLDTSPEFLLDVVTTMQGPSYEVNLRKGIQGFRDSLMEPYLYLSDISKYSGAQGWHRFPIYQVTDDMVTRIKQGGGGMQGLLNHALMTPSLYDPSSDLGINDVWRSIASKSTINEGIDEVKGATLYGRRGSQVGDVMSSRLGVSLGVSYETRVSDLNALLTEGDPLKIQRLIEDRFRGQESTNTYTFDTKGKLASIPQRLKNVGGQKGLMHMTRVAQGILDIERAFLKGEAPLEAIAHLRNQGNWLEKAALNLLQDNDINLVSYMSAYTQTLKQQVGNLNPDASHLITEDMGLAALYGGRLRTVMGPDHLLQLQTYADYLEKETGQGVDPDQQNLAYMVLQAKAVAADMLATGQKGFIGGRVERPLVLLQLSGAYTDNFYANRDYGGGIREGFVETKTVRLRASKLGHQWATKENGLIAKVGDLISFDRERNQVMVLNARGLQKSLSIGQDISSDEVLVLANNMRGQVVDDRSQVMVLDEVIESLHRGEGSSTAQKGVSSYAATRQGEDAIDYLLKVKALPGVTSTGNMEYEFTYASGNLPGGGRRVEGAASGGLFKAVGVMSDISDVLEQRVAGLNDGLTSSIDRVNIQDVFGIVNISNLKSFFYSHGAGILRDAREAAPDRLERVMNKSSGQLVAGLLLHFGDAWLGEADGTLAKALVEFLGKGELGEYHKSLVSGLLLKHKGDTEKVGRELLSHKKTGGSYTSDLDRYNITQLPGLANIDKGEVVKALTMGENSGALAKKLGSLAGFEGGRLSKNMKDSMKLAIDLSNPLHRQASILLTSWDITAQLSSQTLVNVGEMYLGHDTEGNRNLMKVASVMGFDPMRIQRGLSGDNEDTEYSEMARNVALGLSSRVSSVFLEMDLNYSATKEPSGKKHTGNIEGVQMIKPFMNLATEFREGGNLNKLKLLIGNLMAGMSLGETATGIAYDLKLENTLGQARNLMDPMQQEIGSSHKFLGLYGSGIESIEELKNTYAEYEGLVKQALEERVAKAGQKSSLILTEPDPNKKQGLIGERDALLQEAAKLMIEYEDPQSVKGLLGESYKTEYDELLNKMKAVGERYDLLSSKPMGVGLGNAIVGAMAHERSLLFLPEINILGGQDGQVNIHIDKKRGSYSYLPSGEDLGFLGTQYGAHVDEIVMATIRLTGAMTPGTAMNKVMQKLKVADLVGSDRITLSPQEASLLQEYQETFISMNTLLAEKGSGSRLQAATSGKTTLGGGVTTPAPSWWVPEGSILLSKETLRKQGVNDGERAKRYIETQDAIANLEDKPENQVQRTLLKAQSDALLNGLSEAGMYLVSQIRQDRDRLSNLEDYYRQAQDQGDLQRARGLYQEARNLIAINLGRIDEVGKTSYRSILNQGQADAGDRFVVKIGELEMEYFIQAFREMDDLLPNVDNQSILRGIKRGLLSEHNVTRLRQKIEGIEGRLERLDKSQRLIKEVDILKDLEVKLLEVKDKLVSDSGYLQAGITLDGKRVNLIDKYDREAGYELRGERGGQLDPIYDLLDELDKISPKTGANTRRALGSLLARQSSHAARLSETERKFSRVSRVLEHIHKEHSTDNYLEVRNTKWEEWKESKYAGLSHEARDKAVRFLTGLIDDAKPLSPEERKGFIKGTWGVIEEKLGGEGTLAQLYTNEEIQRLRSRSSLIRERMQLRGVFSVGGDWVEKTLGKGDNSKTIMVKKGDKLLSPLHHYEEGLSVKYSSLNQKLQRLHGYTPPIERLSGIDEDIRVLGYRGKRLLKVKHGENPFGLRKAISLREGGLEFHKDRLSKLTEKHGLSEEQIEEALTLERETLNKERAKIQGLLSQEYIDELDKAIETGIIPDELRGAVEARRKNLIEKRSLISRSMLNEFLGSETLGGLDDSIYKGKAKGELTTYSFSREGLDQLSPEGRRSLVKGRLSNLSKQYTDLDRYLEQVEREAYGMGDRGHKLLTSGVQRANLKELISTLSTLGSDLDDELIPIDASIARIEKAVNQLDTTDILQTITFRNAPFGSTETQRQALSILGGLEVINEYIKESRAREGQGGGVLLDITRNQTLTLLNPLSQTTLNLSDFDGDPYTSIFTSLAKFHREARKIQDVITTHEVIINEAQAQLKKEQEKYQALGPALTEEQEKTLLMARTNLGEKVSKSQAEILERRQELNRKLFELEQAKATHTSKYEDAIRREVADYLGVDKRMFMGRERGGFLDQDLDISILPSFLQQGHGLFGGLKGKAASGEQLATLFEKFTEAFVTYKGDTQKLMGEGVLKPFIGEDYAKVYQESEAVRQTLLREVTRITAGVDLDLDFGVVMGQLRPLAQQSAGTLTGILDAQSGANKLMQKAMGASINDDMYSMLTKVLGKAGGDILGRTYNTLVGTLFADSPLIALSHLLTSNKEIKEQATTQLAAFMERKAQEAGVGGDGMAAARKFMDTLQGESTRAEGLQQFMKNAQQLLRDSLKFKKANDTLDKLAESLDKYNAPDATEENRRGLISHIAGQLGPGPGLRAFMQLEELVSRVSQKGFDREVTSFIQQEGGEEWDVLSKQFGVSKSNLYDPNAPSDLLREMELTRKAFGLEVNPEGRPATVREVLEYKVTRDLQNLIAANRMGLSDDAGESWAKTLMQGAEGLLDFIGIEKTRGDKVLDIHERARLAFEGLDERAQVRMLRAQQVMESGWYEKGQSTDKLVALLSHIESSLQESAEAFGYTGERLKRMTTLRVIGKSLTNMAAGRDNASPTLIGDDPDLIKGDVLTSMLQLSASNKLTPEASGQFMNLLANLSGQVPEGSSKLFMALTTISPKDPTEKGIYDLLKEFLHSKEGMSEIGLGQSKALFNGGLREYIESGLESTSVGGRAEFLQEFIKSYGKFTDKREGPTLEGLFKRMMPQEEQQRGAHLEMANLMREQLAKQVNVGAGDWMPKYHFSTPEAQEAAQGRARERVAIAASNLQDRMDMGVGLGVALMSSLLFTGGVSAETAKEAVAGTVMAVGYSKSGKGGWLGGIGGSFRMRMAAMEGAATGQGASWAGNWVMREALFTLGAMAGNALIMKTEIDKKLVKGIAKVFGADVKPMDFDKYANWKGASGTVAGALLSALMGSVTAMMGTQLASGVDNFLPILGALDNAVQSSRELQRQSDERVAVLQAEGVNLSAPDDPLAEALSVSYEIAQGIDDRLMGDYEINNASLSYNDSDIGEMPEAELLLA